MIKRDTLKIQDASSTWSVSLPEDASKGRILGIWDAEGNKLEPDTDDYKNHTITVNFGLDKMSGEMDYEFEDGKDKPLEEPVSHSQGGIVITNTNTNTYGGRPYTQS